MNHTFSDDGSCPSCSNRRPCWIKPIEEVGGFISFCPNCDSIFIDSLTATRRSEKYDYVIIDPDEIRSIYQERMQA